MNKEQIKRELRRSAREDRSPLIWLEEDAYRCLMSQWAFDIDGYSCDIGLSPADDLRTFYLLVAEAL